MRENDQERRECHRLPCRVPVRIYADPTNAADSFFLEALNLSPQGVFLSTDLLFAEGEWLELEFLVPGQAQAVRGKGQVVRVHVSDEVTGPGFAVHLPQLTSEQRQAFRQLNRVAYRVRC